MRIFITGGTGFIGTHVVKELQTEENLLLLLCRQPKTNFSSLEMPNVRSVQGDLSDIASWEGQVKRFNPQVAIHMAWESIPNYDIKTSKKNLIYGLNLISMLAESGCRSVICTGSCWEYGKQSGKLQEDMILKPLNAFSAVKSALHWVGREIAKEYDMSFIWTRLFFVYGPGQKETSLIPHVITHLRRGTIPDIKSPFAKNDFIYVGDVARAISAIVKESEKGGLYNIGSGSSTSIQEIVEIIYEKLNLRNTCSIVNDPMNNAVVDFWADISRMREEFGWEPKKSIDEGIQEVIDSYIEKG